MSKPVSVLFARRPFQSLSQNYLSTGEQKLLRAFRDIMAQGKITIPALATPAEQRLLESIREVIGLKPG